MASKPITESDLAGQDTALPPEIIAQAEAAIAGNAPASQRRPSQTNPSSFWELYEMSDTSEQPGLALSSSRLHDPDTFRPAPPAYSEKHDQIDISQDGFVTQAKVTDDGRVNININQKTRRLSDLLVPALRNQLSLAAAENQAPLPPGYIPPALGGQPGQVPPPHLNVVIHVVGSRGDVQPFVALGKTLKSTYGHRVRLATHPTFQSFVEENELEFFSIGGDPAELMAFMVKNPGLMPGFDSLKSGDVGKRRKGMEEIVLGCWRSCIEAGDGLGAPPRNDSVEDNRLSFEESTNMDTSPSERPFIADAIIANPPSFAHVHIAEKLGIPLHLMFTMPWSPTQSFPHPLANIQSSNADVNMTNFISYALVEMMTWQGLGDVINRFREKALGLDPISLIWAPGMLSRLRIPYTYCWSPALIPKPKDWGQHISISGFYFLSLASSYNPDPELAAFLAAGPTPVYIGFGSIVVEDPNALTKLIYEAVEKTGVRALVSKGWGGLGADELGVPEGIYMLGNVPHDWLFKHVSCVVHHGGAGTTAAGIALGRPTVVVPFFGDQPFWGAMVARAGAGPTPIPFKQLTADRLSAALIEALKLSTLEKAKQLGARISEEKGTEVGGKCFHDHLDVPNLRCSLAPSRVAVWRLKRTKTRLSALAATVLAKEGLLDFADLKLYRPREYETEDGPWDPISGGASALLGTLASLTMGVADFPVEIFRAFRGRVKELSAGPVSSTPDSHVSLASVSQTPSQTDLSMDNVSQQLTDTTSEPLGPRSSLSGTSDTTPPSGSDTLGRASSTDTPLTSTAMSSALPRGTSLKQALRGTISRSRSRSKSRDRQPGSRSSSPRGLKKEFDPSNITLDSAIGASKGISRIVGAGLKSPMDFSLGLARGFHNAPKLYGDDTVRPQEKVTDFQSGLKAAGKEFGYGFYDGISGLITQPLRGAEKEGAAGLIKGIGKGIGGLVLKPGAAIWGLPGYTFMGIHKEVRKLFGSSVLNYIIAARTAQGYEQWKSCTQEERLDIISRWNEHKSELQSERQRVIEEGPEGQETGRLSPKGFLQTRHLSFEERKKLREDRKIKREQERNKTYGEHTTKCPFCRRSAPHQHDVNRSLEDVETLGSSTDVDHAEFEQAIKASVAATSRGNLEEDIMIERAIRASVRELQRSDGSALSEQEALDRAIEEGVAESASGHPHGPTDGTLSRSDPEFDVILEKSIRDSLHESQYMEDSDRYTPINTDTDDDENIRLAIEASKVAHEQHLSKVRAEEEIVMEYVKRQSLAEEEHKKALQKKKQITPDDAEGDIDLKRAFDESLRNSSASNS